MFPQMNETKYSSGRLYAGLVTGWSMETRRTMALVLASVPQQGPRSGWKTLRLVSCDHGVRTQGSMEWKPRMESAVLDDGRNERVWNDQCC